MAKLNRREQAKLNYMQNGGNKMKAMIDAGYSEAYARKNAKFLWETIGQEIAAEQEKIKSPKIKSIKQIQERWSEWMDSEALTNGERIKVSELLAKSQGGFIDKKTKEDKEEQRARIDKIKAETARIKGEGQAETTADDGFLVALQSESESVWQE